MVLHEADAHIFERVTGFIKRLVTGEPDNPTTAVEPANVDRKSSFDFCSILRRLSKKTTNPTTPVVPAPAAALAHPAVAAPPPPHDNVS